MVSLPNCCKGAGGWLCFAAYVNLFFVAAYDAHLGRHHSL